MNEEKENFTPGPWKSVCHTYEGYGEQVWEQLVLDNEENPICQMTCHEDTQEQYSYLIAAAPEMYELLKQIRDVFDANCCIPCSQCHKLQGEIEAIIENVRGEE